MPIKIPTIRSFLEEGDLIDSVGVPKSVILHVAQSQFHDIGPAKAMGLATAWVDRRAGREGKGATPPSDARADLVVPSLEAIASRLLNP